MTAATRERASSSAENQTARLEREILALILVVVMGTSMTVLDLTAVNVALPALGADLHGSISTVQWVMTAYTLAFASIIPVTGWATERFGERRVWIGSLLLFAAGSALAGAAWSIESLIAFRVLQGLGAGLILPVGQSILAQAAGPQRMGRVMSVFGVPLLLVPVIAPLLGGGLVEASSWRWIFLINLPITALAVTAAYRMLPSGRPRARHRLDLVGLGLLSPGLALLLYGLATGADEGGFSDMRALGTVVGGLVFVGLFVWHALVRGPEALLDLSLFRRRAFATAAAANLLLQIALFGTLILLPLYFQLVRGESPLRVGLLLTPQAIGAAFAMPLAGLATDRLGARIVVSTGTVLALLGTLAYTQVSADSSFGYLAAALFILGLGIGSTIMPSMAAAFQAVTRDETPRATGAIHTVQRIGGAIGTALLALVLQRNVAADVADFGGGIQSLSQLAQHPAGASLIANAFGLSFWIAAGAIALSLIPALLLPSKPYRTHEADDMGESSGEGSTS